MTQGLINLTYRSMNQKTTRYYFGEVAGVDTYAISTELDVKVYTGWIFKEEKISSVTPNYFALKLAKAVLPDRGYLWERRSRSGVLVYKNRQQNWPYDGQRYEDSVVYQPIVNTPFQAEFVPNWSEVELKLLKELKGKTWQAGVAWVEARKTSDLIGNSVHRFVNAVRHLRRGRVADFAGVFGLAPSPRRLRRFNEEFGRDPREAASNAILETSFGWQPLVHDMSKAAIALYRAYNQPGAKLITLTSSTKARERRVNPSLQYELSPERFCVETVTEDAQYRIKVRFTPDQDTATVNAQLVGLTNPLETLYELTPWSFLVDYFTTLGDTISALDATVGKTFVSGTRSYRANVTREMSGTRSPFSNRGQSGDFQMTLRRKSRDVLTSFPSVPLPEWRPNLNPQRILNGAALLSQQLSRFGIGDPGNRVDNTIRRVTPESNRAAWRKVAGFTKR